MIAAIALLVIGSCLVRWSVSDNYRGDGMLTFVGGGMVGVCGAVLLIAMFCNRVGVGNELVQIESLRGNVSGVELLGSESIYGQAAETNQLIASNKWYRRQWWARDFVSSAWDTVPPIELILKEKRK